LGTVCVITAVVSAPWAHWAALALAGFGLGVGVPFWLGRSWRDLLELTGLVPLREPVGRRAPGAGPDGRGPGVSPETELHHAYPLHTGSLAARAWETPSEDTFRPQNSFRLAADGFAAGPEREKPIPQGGPEKVIDLTTKRGNFERRSRRNRTTCGAHVNEPPPVETPPVIMDIEEIRRRLTALYGGRLPISGIRKAFFSSPAESPREPISDTCGRCGDDSAPRLVELAGASRMRGKPPGEAALECPPAFQPASGLKVTIDSAYIGSLERFPKRSVEDAAPVQPVETKLLAPPIAAADLTLPADIGRVPITNPFTGGTSGESAIGGQQIHEQKCASAPVLPCEPVAKLDRPSAFVLPDNGNKPLWTDFHGDLCLPPLSLLHPADSAVAPMSQDDLIDGGILIEEKLAEFRVKVNVQDAYAGPVITRYEVQPAVGVRGGQVVSLMKDLARALGVASIRMVETIPGKTCMGLELPNPRRQMIHLSEVLSSEVFQSHPSKLAIALGKDITGEPVVADLARAPHLLVAGTTGSGKSVGVNAMILSLLYRATPDEVRFVMIDPKMLELSIYDGIPHLLAPVVTDMKLAANALNWCVREMERRYRLLSGLGVRNLAGYNQKVREAIEAGEQLLDPFSPALDNPTPLSHLPYIVVVVDELADLMMVAGKKIEELIARLAQKARAAGIHLVIATQRPSVDVITGLIKANIPTRIAFQVSSKIDSRTILDQMGAECLLGQGDMLYLPPGTGYPLRVHGAFVADEEVHAVAEHLKQLGEPQYVEGVLGGLSDGEEGGMEPERFGEDTDPLYDDAVAFVISSRRASISAVQRQLRIGYNRAARLVEQMEASGLVSAMESNGNRTVLVPPRNE
jgi:hypothetical protein